MIPHPPSAPARNRNIDPSALLEEGSFLVNPYTPSLTSPTGMPSRSDNTTQARARILTNGASLSEQDEDDGRRKRRRVSMDLQSPRMGGLEGTVLNGYTSHTVRGERDFSEESPEYPNGNGTGHGQETWLLDGKTNGTKGADAYADDKIYRQRLEDDKKDRSGEGLGLTGKDRNAFILLVVLYLFQGIPIGLIFGTLPFILKPHLSYSELALFSLSTWPYSLKLVWSPVVDAWFSERLGRRKSWIVPVQLVLGGSMWFVGDAMETWIASENINVRFLTAVFVLFIFLAATQDIAVDGWALTLLSPANLSYASTAQTIGLHMGYTISFTVFLALNSPDFANNWLRRIPNDLPIITIGGYLRFWAVMFLLFTVWLAVWKKEDKVSDDDPDMDVRKVYRVMWSILTLKNIQSFIVFHLIGKIGFQVHEITSLKLIEKGLHKEDLALTNLLNFPLEIVGGWLAARWSRGDKPLAAWEKAYWARLGMAVMATLLVWMFPSKGEVGSWYFAAVVGTSLLASFTSTIQFVGIMAFHTQIADPVIGGTYMTLLNTVSNMGGTWPRPLVLRGIDILTYAVCQVPDEKSDGYYPMSALCVTAGVLLLVLFIKPTARRLQALPLSAWRVKIPQ